MKQNVGRKDAFIRLVLGIVLACVGLYLGSWWGLLGIIPVATAFTRFCPLYSLFGFNTCR
jgi:hypothetical protein